MGLHRRGDDPAPWGQAPTPVPSPNVNVRVEILPVQMPLAKRKNRGGTYPKVLPQPNNPGDLFWGGVQFSLTAEEANDLIVVFT